MFPSKFLQFPSILTHFHAANEKIQNGGRDLAISRGLVWVKSKNGTALHFLLEVKNGPQYFSIYAIRSCYNRADLKLAPSQWEALLQTNTDYHWLGANLESAQL